MSLIKMKALSIMQPWAWLIVNGLKDIENRDWKNWNPGLKFRGKFLVHAGKKYDRDADEFIHKMIPDVQIPTLYVGGGMGGIVGMAEVVDVVTEHKSPWFFGPQGLVIGRARPLPFMPLKGQLGFFDANYEGSLLNG